jgi:Rrf2 family protein
MSGTLRISARSDYAVRAAIELAVAHETGRVLVTEAIGEAQAIPRKFLEQILTELKQAGIVHAQRGVGHWLAKRPDQITVADVLRAVEGPLASVRGLPPEDIGYAGNAEPLHEVWIAVRSALRDVVEHVTLADLAAGQMPREVRRFSFLPGARRRRQPAGR